MKKETIIVYAAIGILITCAAFYIASSMDVPEDPTTTITTEIANGTFRFIAIGEGEYIAIGKLKNVKIDVGESIQDALVFQDGNKTKDIHVLNAEEWQWSLGEWYKVRIKVEMFSQILDAKTIEPVVRVVIPKYKYQ